MTQTPKSVAEEILLPLRTFDGLEKGFVALARSIARQRAQARVGGAVLVVGFLMQLAAYLFTDGSAHFANWTQRVVATLLVVAEWLVVYAVWRAYVPRSAAATYEAAVVAREADVARRQAEADPGR